MARFVRWSVLLLFVVPVVAWAAETAADLDFEGLARVLYRAIQGGQWATVISVVIVLLVAGLKKWGKHIPNVGPFLETTLGGWTLNFLTTASGSLSVAAMAGAPVTWVLLAKIAALAFSTAGALEFLRDLGDWWKRKRTPLEAAKDAGAAAAADPGPTINA